MYIQTVQYNPLVKPCDVTFPNSSDYEAYYIISFSSSSHSLSLTHPLSRTRALSQDRKPYLKTGRTKERENKECEEEESSPV